MIKRMWPLAVSGEINGAAAGPPGKALLAPSLSHSVPAFLFFNQSSQLFHIEQRHARVLCAPRVDAARHAEVKNPRGHPIIMRYRIKQIFVVVGPRNDHIIIFPLLHRAPIDDLDAEIFCRMGRARAEHDLVRSFRFKNARISRVDLRVADEE